jgi:thioredoxin 1
MGTIGIVVAGLVLVLLALTIGLQLVVRARANALKGTEVPELPGGIGKRIAASKHALVYFFSPQCGACRAITPRIRELGKKNSSVFAVDVMQDMGVARALRVMATPSTVEIDAGKVVGYHIGLIPEDVMARFQ